MADETTPDHRRQRTLRLRNQFEAKLRDAREANELRAADEFPDEPSVRVEGEPKAVAELLERVRGGPMARIQESLAPISRRMGTRGGKIAAIATGVVTVLGALLEVLRQAGVFGP